MFAIFEAMEDYQAQNELVNNAVGYPCEHTTRYAEENPRLTSDGKYAMQILPYVEHLFIGCEIVESVVYPEVEDD